MQKLRSLLPVIQKHHKSLLSTCDHCSGLVWTSSPLTSTSPLRPSRCYYFAQKRNLSSFVTTPIFYVNSSPHIGHLYTALLTDAYNRFAILKGEDRSSVIFSTGTDEHGMKIEKAAKEAGLRPEEHCNIVSNSFRRMCQEFDVDFTHFIRTTSDQHKIAVSYFWVKNFRKHCIANVSKQDRIMTGKKAVSRMRGLEEKGYIYKCHYEGWYCVQDETFLRDFQVTDGTGKDGKPCKVSIESGHPVEWCKEENYMFKLEQFVPDIIKWIETENPIQPSKFGSIVINWLREGFQDLSVSRPRSRISWGIPVPGDESQSIYVWLDALINYLTVAGYPEQHQTKWPPTVQVVGKDILKFHAIYWPAFLLANGLELPRRILCHSHWTIDNVKMSKSLGNVVDPFKLKERYGSEAVRFFLLSQGTPHADGNFNEAKMIKMVNTALADTLGNLLSRCSAPALNPHQIWPEFNSESSKILSQNGLNLKNALESLHETVQVSYEEFNFYRGIEHILAVLRLANLFVQEEKPWELVKTSPRSPQLLCMMSLVLETLRVSGILLLPIVPSLSSSLLNRLNVSPEDRYFERIRPFIWEIRFDEKPLGVNPKLFFQRIKV